MQIAHLMAFNVRTQMRSQSGAAIIMAMLIMALATVIVSGLFWRQHVTIRSIENRSALSQTRWIERAATDWARVVLRADMFAAPRGVDHLGESWALQVAETKLDATVTAGATIDSGATNASLSGQVFDMQGRFNLRNLLLADGKPNIPEVDAFKRLLTLVDLPSGIAQGLITHLQSTRAQLVDGVVVPATTLPLKRVADLGQIKGFDARALQALEPFVTVLPVPTKININTTSAEVLAARVVNLDLASARSLIGKRDRKFFSQLSEAQTILNATQQLPEAVWSVGSAFFLVRGLVKYDRVESRSDTLLERKDSNKSIEVIWQDRY
jgi:general secretion pathway protein K